MKLNYKRTLLVGLAFLSISAFWQLYDAVVPLILRDTFGIDDFISGFIMAADNVLALLLLPLLGALSDRVHTPIGRRMPFILCGTAAAVVAWWRFLWWITPTTPPALPTCPCCSW